MWYYTLLASLGASLFSTAVMSYISMATVIGPWIAPTIALLAIFIFRILGVTQRASEQIALITAAGSIGGIIGTACGFSFPTLYFLDASLFNSWMASRTYFCFMLGGVTFLAGAFGLLSAQFLEYQLIDKEKLPFPIGELVYKMISARESVRKSYELFIGLITTTIFCFLQDGWRTMVGLIPKCIVLIQSASCGFIRMPTIALDLWPMVWAIGFVTGHITTIPLAIGALAKIVMIDPLQSLFFAHLSLTEFTLAFCSGMIVIGVFVDFAYLSGALKSIKQIITSLHAYTMKISSAWTATVFTQWLLVIGATLLFFAYVALPAYVTLYLMVGSLLCIYQIAIMAGKIGIAPLGRFATFVMVPAMLIFGINYVHIVLIATFVEISCGVVADILFGRKLAHLTGIGHRVINRYQWLGLIVSSLSIGIFFWLLINRFGLGSVELFAQKAQNRQLLIHVKQFDYYVLILGALFGWLLKYLRINASLVLGGLLMPINLSLGLVIGGLGSLATKHREEWYPFWSGVFAANSLWMLLRAVV